MDRLENLDKIKFDISIEKLEKKVEEYYKNVDPSIIEIKATYNYAWRAGNEEYGLGSQEYMTVDVDIKRQIKVLGEDCIDEKRISLEQGGIMKALDYFLKEEDYEIYFITKSYEDENAVSVSCTKLSKEKEKTIEQKSTPFQQVKQLIKYLIFQ